MKRLLLFIVVLFGSMSAMSLADGCMAQVCTCSNGGYVSYGEYCAATSSPSYSPDYSMPRVWFAFSYDSTRKIYGIGEGDNKKTAVSESLTNCGTSECKVIKSLKEPNNHMIIVLSSNDIMEFKSFGSYYDDREESAYYEDLLKKCKDKGGINCKVVFNSDRLLYNSKAYKKKFGYLLN